MGHISIKDSEPQAVAEEAFWLAWRACGSALGMGVFRDRPSATKADVLHNIGVAGDYPFNISSSKPNELYGDYVFGRMMKLHLTITASGVEFPDSKPTTEYQSWARKYPTYEELVSAAQDSLSRNPPEK